MPIWAKPAGKTFEPAPAGRHHAVCVDVVDLGPVETKYDGETRIRDMVRLVFQIEDRREDGTRYLVFQRYTNSLHPKARLRHDLVSWRGRDFTPEEERRFDLERLIGANCELVIVHSTSNGKTYANVSAIIPAGKSAPKLECDGYVRVVDREDAPANDSSAEDFQSADAGSDDVPF